MDLVKIRKLIDQKKVEKELLYKRLKSLEDQKTDLQTTYENSLKAREVIQQVAQKTLKQLSHSTGELVTKALHAVFKNPYDFKVEFVSRRNQTECDLLLARGNLVISPLDAAGGGVVDVTGFSLRATFLVLVQGSRPILFLDEPFKFVSADLQEYCGMMLKMVSEQLGYQIIMVTHLPKMIDSVDKVINVKLIEGISSVD